MELKFDKRGIGYLKPLLREIQTQEQTQELRLTDGMPDIGRILGTWGQVILRGKEWRGDSVGCNGGVMAHVLYAPEDGSDLRTINELQALFFLSTFTELHTIITTVESGISAKMFNKSSCSSCFIEATS